MDFYGDYHTHTRHSDGRQELGDIVSAAAEKGLKEVAVTDHGPLAAVIGVKNQEDYLNIKEEINQLRKQHPGIEILLGAEANIRDLHGTLDIDPEIINQLDILIAGMHPYTLPTSVKDGADIFLQNSLRHLGRRQHDKAVKANTQAIIAVLNQNPQVDILSHPGLFFEVDILEVARACKEHGVLFEINCGHEHPKISDIMVAERTGVNFIINSDAHFPDTVGALDYGMWMINRLGIAEERIVNSKSGGGSAVWMKKLKNYEYS